MKIIEGKVTESVRLGRDDFIIEMTSNNGTSVTLFSKSNFKAKKGDKIKIEINNDK